MTSILIAPPDAALDLFGEALEHLAAWPVELHVVVGRAQRDRLDRRGLHLVPGHVKLGSGGAVVAGTVDADALVDEHKRKQGGRDRCELIA